jgi:glycosyltransferase involved in cell wall biosynthesis
MIEAPRTIAVDLTPLLPGGENGGAKVFVLELLRTLPRLVPRCEFVLLTRSSTHAELAALDGVNVRRVQVLVDGPAGDAHTPPFGFRAQRLARVLPVRIRRLAAAALYRWKQRRRRSSATSLLRAIRADLLYCPFTAPTYAEPGVPVVCTVHDIQYKTYPQFFSVADVEHRDAVFRSACREATRLAAVSDYARDSSIRHGELDPSRIRTVHSRLAARFAATVPAGEDVLSRLELKPRSYLLYPANFWKHKNHEMLLTAFGIAVQGALPPEICLVCTGAPGARSEFLAQAAAAMGLAARMRFPGFLDAAAMGTLLRESAGVVFPSLYEGFGLPVLEAMACGVPVACSNTTSLPDIAAGAAIEFDPRVVSELSAAIIALCTDVPLRRRLVTAGMTRAQEFSDVTRMAREYWELFVEAFRDGRRQSSIGGVYADGWVGAEMVIDVVSPAGAAALEFEMTAPDWLPHARVHVAVCAENGGRSRRLSLRRGERRRWSVPVRDGIWQVRIAPGFVPAQCGHGDDQRLLTLMLGEASVRGADGRTDVLWGGA